MLNYNITELTQTMPEIILLFSAVVLLIFAAYRGDKFMPAISSLAMLSLLFSAFIESATPQDSSIVFNGMYVNNGYTAFTKLIIMTGAFFSLFLSTGYYRKTPQYMIAEFPVLVLLATAGMMLMVSANNLLSLYMALELQSLALYIIATLHKDNIKSSEAGLKYFVLGALASGIMLYGISLVYGFSGTIGFGPLAEIYTAGAAVPIGVTIGMVMILAGLCFKVSAAPFHMWTPDVYEGAPITVTAFFAVAPKVAAVGLLVSVVSGAFVQLAGQWQQVIVLVSALSMIVGAFGAFRQTNLKRLMAYSSIGHVGFILTGLAAANVEGVRGILIYMFIYMTLTLGMFACIMMIKQKEGGSEDIYAFAGLAKSRPMLAMATAIILFSMAGIPPFAGFFGKFFVFMAAIKAGLYGLAVLGVISSVVSAFYYLRIIKIIYFDEVGGTQLDRDMSYEMNVVILSAAVFNLFFFTSFTTVLNSAAKAASVFFG